jgi:Cu+-exporting ATPase
MKKVLLLLFGVILLISCNEKEGKGEQVAADSKITQSAEPDMKKIALNIEGMTCEIGCARTIQSKLSKKEGVAFAEVNFEKKEGIVEFDANKISQNQIVETIEKIAGGDLYKVTKVSEN